MLKRQSLTARWRALTSKRVSSETNIANWIDIRQHLSGGVVRRFALSRCPGLSSALILGLGTFLFSLSGCGGLSTGTAPGYTITASALNPDSITAGSASKSVITVTPANGYKGSIRLSCDAFGGVPAPTCSFGTSPVVITGPEPVVSTMTITTSRSTPGGSYAILVTGKDAANGAPTGDPEVLMLTTAAVLQRVVVIFQENRSPDNLFHDPVLISRGADIASNGKNSHGQTIPLSPIDLGTSGSDPQNYDLSHSHSAFVSMYDGGKMDGADLIPCVPVINCRVHPDPQFMYVKPSDVQPYFDLAEQYTFGDRMFQTNQGPSFPAHQFIISGTSAPAATSNLFAAENPKLMQQAAGCIAPRTKRF